MSSHLPNHPEKQKTGDEPEKRTFEYQPDCSLDSEREKEENQAHLDAHPEQRFLQRDWQNHHYDGR
jgi:hypothetical protein